MKPIAKPVDTTNVNKASKSITKSDKPMMSAGKKTKSVSKPSYTSR